MENASVTPRRRLDRGTHLSPDDGACLMEEVSRTAGLPWSDAPRCTHPLLAHLARLVNDASSEAGRQDLAPLVPLLAAAGSTDPDRSARTSATVALACTRVALARRPTVLLGWLDRRARSELRREDRSPTRGLPTRLRRRLFVSGPGARAVEAAVGACLRLPAPDRDAALAALLAAGLAATTDRANESDVACLGAPLPG